MDLTIQFPAKPPRHAWSVVIYEDAEGKRLVERTTVVGVAPRGWSRFMGIGAVQFVVDGRPQMTEVQFAVPGETIAEAFEAWDAAYRLHAPHEAQKLAQAMGLRVAGGIVVPNGRGAGR